MKAIYKIIGAVLSIAVIPVAIFLPLVKIVVTSSILSIFSSSDSTVLLNNSYSIYDLYKLISENSGTTSNINMTELINSFPQNVRDELGPPLIAFIVLFALVLICAIALMFIAIFSKKRKALIITGIIGVALTIGMNIAFNHFAEPLISGTISIIDLVTESSVLKELLGNTISTIGALLSTLLSGSAVLDIRLLEMGTSYVFMLLCFGGITIWGAANALIDWGK